MPSAAARAAAAAAAEAEDNPLSGATVELLLGTASDIVENISSKNTVFDTARDDVFPTFERNEVVTGRVLGRGGFCVVYEIKTFRLDETGGASRADKLKNSGAADNMSAYEEAFTRHFISKRAANDKGDARYAIKKLSNECTASDQLFLKGTIDLAVEARFLAVLEHPHIIKLRAVAHGGPFTGEYFLVLDRLYDTLEQRLKKWSSKARKTKGVIGALSGGKKRKNKLDVERIHAAYDLSSALNYIHSNNIVYRDLKPENIGFDVRGDLKIFDFGLAKELHDSEKNEDGTYKLTGFTGSLRYMAPEVHKGLPYNQTADSYSFGIMFWHIMALEAPFSMYSCKLHDEMVIQKGARPVCDKAWPKEWSTLMKQCWDQNLSSRPGFKKIALDLAKEAEKYLPSEEDGGLDISVRNTKYFEKAKGDKK